MTLSIVLFVLAFPGDRRVDDVCRSAVVHRAAFLETLGPDRHARDSGPELLRLGARLRARYNRGADGSRAPRGDFEDTHLGLVCSWRTAEDGVTRCLPVARYGVGYPTYFVDDACSVAAVDVPCAAGTYVSGLPASDDACSGGERIYQIGAAVAPGSQRWMRDPAENCVAAGSASPAGLVRATPLLAAAFVGATIETDP